MINYTFNTYGDKGPANQFYSMAKRQTHNIAFYCRPSEMDIHGKAPVIISISINGDRQFIQTQVKENPEDFKKAMESKRSHPIKDRCKVLERKLNDLEDEMMMANIPLTATALKQYFKRGGVNQVYTLNDLFAEYLAILIKRVGVNLSKDTYNRYIKASKYFLELNQLTGEEPVTAATNQHALNMQAELNRLYDPATSCNYLQKAKTFFKYAFEAGKISIQPFMNVHIDKGNKDDEIKYLTEAQIDQIRQARIQNPRLQHVRDAFLFACFTGVGFADIAALEPEDYLVNDKGMIYIHKKRVKTGVYYTTVLLQDALSIAKKYNYNIPISSNQKFNDYLKEIAAIANLDESITLTYYVARHTTATYLLNHGVSLEVVSKVLGHKSTKETIKYAKLLDKSVFDAVSDLVDMNSFDWQSFSPNPGSEPQRKSKEQAKRDAWRKRQESKKQG